jgi:hypothetical protein
MEDEDHKKATKFVFLNKTCGSVLLINDLKRVSITVVCGVNI